ncbi:MAG: hypothetical protein ACYSYL_21130 [Planctomycetota bacterium]
MCGIAGFNWQDKSIIEEMARTMRHRGPDDGPQAAVHYRYFRKRPPTYEV